MLKLSQGLLTDLLGGTSSFKEIFAGGTLVLRSGTQPDSANDAERGEVLAQITLDGGEFVPGLLTNGLNFGDVTWDPVTVTATLSKVTGESWTGLGLAAGTIGWARFYDNAMVLGASTTARRFDGVAAIGGGEFALSSAVTKIDVPVTVSTCNINQSAYRR